MKKIHIFGLVVIAVAIGIILSTTQEVSTYTDFTEAQSMEQSGSNADVHVVGKLKKDATGNIMGQFYDPAIDANRFEFILVDNKNREQKVIYSNPKPQDFDKSEQLVIIGKMQGDVFKCNKILLKCPSKYKNEKVEFKEAKS